LELRGARIAVTGATGFLGRYIAEGLIQRGAKVIGVVRNPSRVPELLEMGVEMRQADLGDSPSLIRGFQGVDAIISNAALVAWANPDPVNLVATNIQGAQNVFTAANEVGAKRIIHISSTSAYGYRGHSRVNECFPLRAQDAPLTHRSAYRVSKARAESWAWEYCKEKQISLTTFRPCGIYGIHDTNYTGMFKKVTRLRITLYPAFLDVNVVYGGDVAEAVALALEKDVSIGRAYNLAGGDATAWDFYRAWLRVTTQKAPWLTIPVPIPFRSRLDTTRAREELGWAPRSYEDGIRDWLAREAPATSSTETK